MHMFYIALIRFPFTYYTVHNRLFDLQLCLGPLIKLGTGVGQYYRVSHSYCYNFDRLYLGHMLTESKTLLTT